MPRLHCLITAAQTPNDITSARRVQDILSCLCRRRRHVVRLYLCQRTEHTHASSPAPLVLDIFLAKSSFWMEMHTHYRLMSTHRWKRTLKTTQAQLSSLSVAPAAGSNVDLKPPPTALLFTETPMATAQSMPHTSLCSAPLSDPRAHTELWSKIKQTLCSLQSEARSISEWDGKEWKPPREMCFQLETSWTVTWGRARKCVSTRSRAACTANAFACGDLN